MKYKTLLLLILFLPIASSIPSLNLQNNQTQPGETIFATITTPGEFTKQIEKSQIKFFEGRKQVALETDITFYNQTHYLYIYTNQEANLTIQIENVLYKEGDKLQSTTLTKNITIKKEILTNEETNESYTQIIKIKPGIIFTSSTPKLKLTNLGTSQLNFTFEKQEISIDSLATYELEFTPTEIFSLTKISTYKDFLIPTIYLKASENTTFVSPTTKADLRQAPDLVMAEIFTNTKSEETIQLFNFGNENLTNLEIFSSLDFIETPTLEDMPGKGIQNITIIFNAKTPGHFQGTINITYTQNEKENTLQIPLSIFVLPEGTTPENFEIKEETCQELSGQVCGPETLCNGTATFTKNSEYCCLDSCIEKEPETSKSSGYSWLVGIVILIILGLIGYYFYKKQKQLIPQTPKDSLQITTEKFEKRLSGNKSQRTTGNLTKS